MLDHKKISFTLFLTAFSITAVVSTENENLRAAAAAGADTIKGNCSCGGFASENPSPEAEPLIAQTVLTVPCTAEGDNTCRSLCQVLADTTKAKGPELLCQRLANVFELKFAAFYKSCEHPWTYIGMKSEEPLCCENGNPKPCPSAGGASPAASADGVPPFVFKV